MKISQVGINKVINMYEKNNRNIEKTKKVAKKDSLEISQVGKSLSSFAAQDKKEISQEKLEKIRNEVAKGTYNVDAKLVAQKMIDIMKGREI
ncbi:flagellar biosynthesis anti-sigma factor FlgM [Clostridium ganghwense]|uniref:Negative regulator of flagellin synthesis n=1 Tax=Clostridium ganghwense TaxID=312089 RepID=A0ABT4CN06_9CLOT|nr:flagellar biosynthesis anti-sigma factor FlgM [Clostridium ganghwense]MCY6370427.1 flagellar biosynthesis anti-sigma factor FlgM [Clostridium ganghwense]